MEFSFISMIFKFENNFTLNSPLRVSTKTQISKIRIRIEMSEQMSFSVLHSLLNLSYDGGGGFKVPTPIFICETNRKSVKIMHCVEKKNFDWQF